MERMLTRETAFAAISAIIVAILGTQFVAGFVDTGRWGWPIIAYPMYATAHFDGDRFDDYHVYAVLADGSRLRVDPEELGMSFWIFRRNVVNQVETGSLEGLAPIVERYCERGQARLKRFEVIDLGMAISATGLIKGLKPNVAAALDVACPEAQQQ